MATLRPAGSVQPPAGPAGPGSQTKFEADGFNLFFIYFFPNIWSSVKVLKIRVPIYG